LQVSVPCFKQPALKGLRRHSDPSPAYHSRIGRQTVSAPSGSPSPDSCLLPGVPLGRPVSTPGAALAIASVGSGRPVTTPVKRVRVPGQVVRFKLTQNTEHEITPYSQVYGQHPRFFNFEKDGQHCARLDDLLGSPRRRSKTSIGFAVDPPSPAHSKDLAFGLPGICVSPQGYWGPHSPSPFSPSCKLPMPPSPIALRSDWF